MLRVFSQVIQCTLGFTFHHLKIKRVKTFSRGQHYFIFLFIGFNRSQNQLNNWVNDDWLISNNISQYRPITDIRWESKCSKKVVLLKLIFPYLYFRFSKFKVSSHWVRK
jgi:uncharacterized membrane protein YbaN (DUF454 family)